MAIFYPSNVRDFHHSEGEKLVYKALHKLSDEYVVFYSFRWLGTITQRRSEGEADFVVLHPLKGILSIEVKAGDIGYRGGNWIQTNRHTGEEKVIDPLGQAAESEHRISDFLRRKGIPTMPLMGRAAWFTSVAVPKGAHLPMEAVPDIILDEGSLADPEAALERVYDYWRRNLHYVRAPELSRSEFQEMIRLLMPEFRFTRTISSTNLTAQPTIVRLTRQQGAVLDFLEDQRTCAIHGPAGTGKTVLAVEKARRLAEEGRKVLYLCYNEFLLDHIRRENQGSPVSFHNVRSLAEELMGKCGETDAEEVRAFETWFPEEGESTWPYEDVVVDEGQDLTDTMLETLWLLTDEREGAFYVFYDRNQRVIRREKRNWIDANAECRVVLSRDVRNTAEIASSMASVIGLKRRKQYINEVHGFQPCMSLYRDPAGLHRICDNFVKEMLENHVKLEEMVILSIHSLPHSGLAGVGKIYGIPVSVEPEAGKVWLTNVYRFKGLEAKAVLLLDVEMSALTNPFTRRLIYTGGSRASAYLKLALKEDIPKNGYGALLSQMGAEGKSARDLAAFWGMEIK